MTTSKQSGYVVFFFVAVAALYFTWTAFDSSRCVSVGIEAQTRTTWAPSGGCIAVDGHKKPWSPFIRDK